MSTPPFLVVAAAPVIAATFGVVGIVHLAGPRQLTSLLARLEYPRGFHRVIGVYALITALFLALPLTRIWGVAAAAFVLFAGIVGLLNHRRYMTAMPAIALLAALPFALATGLWHG
jgi:hypothetical protein